MKHLLIFMFCSFGLLSNAQNTVSVNSDNVTIEANSDVQNLINLHTKKNENTNEISGYRIQIIANNEKAKVYSEKAKVYQHFSEFKTYLKYVQPYYKLRIGDFKTRLEARNYLERVIRVFPSAFIVLDDIKVR